jgi:hypothetical protein
LNVQNGTALSKAAAQDAVLKILQAAATDISLSELFNALAEKGFNEVDVKTAVWQLIDKQTVEMTSQRRLRSLIQPSCRAATA